MGLLEVEPSCLGVTAGGSGVGASRVAAHCGDRLLSEPKAGTQPLRREPLLMPQSRPPPSSFGLRIRGSCGEQRFGYPRANLVTCRNMAFRVQLVNLANIAAYVVARIVLVRLSRQASDIT
jgi:hypothetical protein